MHAHPYSLHTKWKSFVSYSKTEKCTVYKFSAFKKNTELMSTSSFLSLTGRC